jgi:hypothetical protein
LPCGSTATVETPPQPPGVGLGSFNAHAIWGRSAVTAPRADRRQWSYVKRLFWESRPEANSFDQAAGRVAQNAYNTGLGCGFIQGRQVARNQKNGNSFGKTSGGHFR